MAVAKMFLDLPTEGSYGSGRSVVRPIRSTAAIASPEWITETEKYMRHNLAKAERAGDWKRFVFLHVREHRWRALASILPKVTHEAVPVLFRDVWMDSEDIWRERRLVKRVLSLIHERDRAALFTKADKRLFDALPDPLTIYRGAKKWNQAGMSWTLDIYRAVRFAIHTNQDGEECLLPPSDVGIVMKKIIRKSAVLFYTNERHEDEIVLTRFEKGTISPEGMLAVAFNFGPKVFSEELTRQKSRLSASDVQAAIGQLVLMRETTRLSSAAGKKGE